MILIDGKAVHQVPADDRSYQYGDGCFSTLLSVNGKVQYWEYHRQRLEACLNALLIPSPDWNQIQSWVETLTLPDNKSGIKIHISRGSGGRGYSPEGINTPRVMVSSFTYPVHYNDLLAAGIELGVCQQKMGLNPLLAGHKHNNRLEQVLLKAEVSQAGYIDGVVSDIHHHVVETTMANIFWFSDGKLFTPSLEKAGVCGVMRRVVTELAAELGITLSVSHYYLEEVLSADEIFITNSILGVAPVIRIKDSCYDIGKKTREIQKRVNVC